MNHSRSGSEVKNLDLSEKIIQNYRAVTQTVRPDYLAYLTQKSRAYSDRTDQSSAERERDQINIDKAMVAMVDRIFGMLEAYTQEINRVNRARELHLTAVPPSRPSEALELNRLRQPSKSTSFYRTRFSTSKLSLVVRGVENRVEFFIIAADRVIGLSHEEACYEPIMIFEVEIDIDNISRSGSLNWTVEQKPLTLDRFERYSLLALEHLIDRTQEELGGSR